MRISLNWLRDYIDVELPLPSLLDKLNTIGLMVDYWEERNGDVILEIDTYPNRPDTLGHLGIARELAAALKLPLKERNWPLVETEERTSNLVDVQTWDEELCPRYCGIIVRNIQVAPSPEWLRKRIEAMGLKPINNVVDVTNYVLFSTAHPIHAFDLAKIRGRKVIIRRAKNSKVLRSLEDKDISLSSEMLVIADEGKPIALAGVIGGLETGVTGATRDVFIESACFDPVSVRKASKKTGISTDASYRFERGADVSFPPKAAMMAASLLTQFGGSATREIVDVYPKPRKTKTVVLRHNRLCEFLGLEVDEGFILESLSRLGIELSPQQKGIWQARIPHWRVDLEREEDLIEEVARFYGYDKIPAAIPPLKVLEPPLDQKRKKLDKLRCLLFNQGYDEVLNFSFSDPEKEAVFQTGRRPVEIRNPVSSKASILKTQLLGGLLENIAWNRNRDADGVHIFEVGNIYFRQNEIIREELTLELATTGLIDPAHWQKKSEETDFFHLKGTIEALMSQLRYEPFSFQEEKHPFFEPDCSLALTFKEEKVGGCGRLKKKLLDSYGLKEPVWAAEVSLAALFAKQPQPFLFAPLARFPSVSRDISFLVDRSVSYQAVKDAVEELSIPYLKEFGLVDLFRGGSIPESKVSLLVRFLYVNPQRTLLAEEVAGCEQKIIEALRAKFNIQLREGGKIDKRAGKN